MKINLMEHTSKHEEQIIKHSIGNNTEYFCKQCGKIFAIEGKNILDRQDALNLFEEKWSPDAYTEHEVILSIMNEGIMISSPTDIDKHQKPPTFKIKHEESPEIFRTAIYSSEPELFKLSPKAKTYGYSEIRGNLDTDEQFLLHYEIPKIIFDEEHDFVQEVRRVGIVLDFMLRLIENSGGMPIEKKEIDYNQLNQHFTYIMQELVPYLFKNGKIGNDWAFADVSVEDFDFHSGYYEIERVDPSAMNKYGENLIDTPNISKVLIDYMKTHNVNEFKSIFKIMFVVVCPKKDANPKDNPANQTPEKQDLAIIQNM